MNVARLIHLCVPCICMPRRMRKNFHRRSSTGVGGLPSCPYLIGPGLHLNPIMSVTVWHLSVSRSRRPVSIKLPTPMVWLCGASGAAPRRSRCCGGGGACGVSSEDSCTSLFSSVRAVDATSATVDEPAVSYPGFISLSSTYMTCCCFKPAASRGVFGPSCRAEGPSASCVAAFSG